MTPTAGKTTAPPCPPMDWGFNAISNLSLATQTYLSGISAYATEFFVPYLISTFYFKKVESERIFKSFPTDTFQSYFNLFDFNFDLVSKSFTSALDIMGTYGQNETDKFLSVLNKSMMNHDINEFDEYARHQFELMNNLVYGYPQAITDIEPEFGFHFEKGEHKLIAETDRFYLYQVAPSEKGIEIEKNKKPILIIPPYVLGANILCFLPGEKRSYVHSFANKGFPTYIRILKNIETSEALQLMTPEDDAIDTRDFCETILKRNGKPVTLNGYCQGGFNALCDLLSGELDGLVDTFITCVAPMEGTRSEGLSDFLKRLPTRFNDLAYGTKTLPNGNKVADGRLMGWVYRLKSIATEQPIAAFLNNMMLVNSSRKGEFKFTKMAAALNYWLINERSDLPLGITKVSFASYNTPITSDGVLPIKLFGRELNLKRIKEKNIAWLICYGVHDNLVEPDTALAPLDHIQVEVTPFPKGHVAIATSWSSPNSACALDSRFGEGAWRGPVLAHMEWDMALDTGEKKLETSPPISVKKAKSEKASRPRKAVEKKKAVIEKESLTTDTKTQKEKIDGLTEPQKTAPAKEAISAQSNLGKEGPATAEETSSPPPKTVTPESKKKPKVTKKTDSTTGKTSKGSDKKTMLTAPSKARKVSPKTTVKKKISTKARVSQKSNTKIINAKQSGTSQKKS